MDPAAVARSPCGGLRAALLRGGGAPLALDPTPLRPLARELGATVRELGAYCRTLAREGVLDGVQVEWSATLPNVRWRGLASGAAVAAVRSALPGLPGVIGCDEVDEREPALWFDLVARSPERAAEQAERLQPVAAALQWQRSERPRCDPVACHGPCTKPALAAACEAGPLPLCTHPYRPLADASARPEREVLATLRRWQRQGQVARIGLALAHAPQARLHRALVRRRGRRWRRRGAARAGRRERPAAAARRPRGARRRRLRA